MESRWCPPIVMYFALFPVVDTKRLEDHQDLGRIGLISNLSEVRTVVTTTAIASTFLDFRVEPSRRRNKGPSCPRPEWDGDHLLAGSNRLFTGLNRLLRLAEKKRRRE